MANPDPLAPKRPDAVGAANGFARQTRTVTLASFLSRLLGVVREQVIAYYFGAGAVTDAFVAAFRIPNLLRDFLAEGAFSAAFVPTFMSVLKRDGREAAFALLNRVLGVFLPFLTLLCVAGIIFTPQIAALLSGGVEATPGKVALLATMARLMFPFLLLIALAAVLMGALNAFGRFGLPALAPAGFNIGMIAAVVVLSGWIEPPGLALAWGVLAGGVLQWGVQAWMMRRTGFRHRLQWGWSDPNVRQMAKLMVPALFGQAAVQINIFAITRAAWTLGDGPVAYLNFAFRILFVPLGVFAVAAATVGLSRLSERVAADDAEGVRTIFVQGIQTVLYLVVPTTLAFAIMGQPICAALYQRGEFDATATAHTARALAFYAVGLPAMAAIRVTAPLFYAHKDTRTPTWCGVVSVVVNLIGMAVLVGPFGYAGLALSVAVAALVQVLLLILLARRRYGPLGMATILVRTIVFAAVGLVAVGGADYVRRIGLLDNAPFGVVGATATSITVAAIVYITVLWAIGFRQFGSIFRSRRI